MTTATNAKTIRKREGVNGVNVEQMFETINAIKGMPAMAHFRFRVSNRWLDGGHNRSMINGFYGANENHRTNTYVFANDEPPLLLGEDQGANPVEYLLHALAGCLTTSLVYHAAAKGIKLDDVSSELEGDIDLRGFLGLDPNIRRGFQQIRVTFHVKADAPDEVLDEIVATAQRYSPVYDSVSNPVEVVVKRAT